MKKIPLKTSKILTHIAILLTGILVGISIIFSYQHIQGKKDAAKRDQTLDFLNETTLLINENQALYKEVDILQKEISKDKTSFEIAKNIDKNMEKLKMILGKTEIKGPGITITIHKNLPYYVFIDMINDFHTYGAEAISINGILITDKTGFRENPLTNQVFINHTPIAVPYNIQVIGNNDTLYNSIKKTHSTISRIETTYNIKDQIEVEKNTEIILQKAKQ